MHERHGQLLISFFGGKVRVFYFNFFHYNIDFSERTLKIFVSFNHLLWCLLSHWFEDKINTYFYATQENTKEKDHQYHLLQNPCMLEEWRKLLSIASCP
jgi:hypothetical protein